MNYHDEVMKKKDELAIHKLSPIVICADCGKDVFLRDTEERFGEEGIEFVCKDCQ